MGHPKFYNLLDQLKETHQKKSASYATQAKPFKNYETAASFLGIMPYMYVLGRAAEKFERLNKLTQVDGESLQETLMDIAALCLIASVMLDE